MTSNQPIHGHGGNAKIDEEVTIMVSKAMASLDAWLKQAEAVLNQQRELAFPRPRWRQSPRRKRWCSTFAPSTAFAA